MTPSGDATATKVRSRDDTEIAFWVSGEGPPLVLVHGTTADHMRWRPLLPFLEPHATVYALDRRGRGGSGDPSDYDVTREFEDVAAVVDAVAEDAGSPVDVYGHSYGAFCSLGAATLTSNIGALVIYEPPLGAAAADLQPGVAEQMEALLSDGKREAVVELMMREVVLMPEAEFEVFRAQPSWTARVDAAHTIPRELLSVTPEAFDLERAASIDVPALVIAGGDSPAFFRRDIEGLAASMPDARLVVIEGQQHVADVLVPEVFAQHVVSFLSEVRGGRR